MERLEFNPMDQSICLNCMHYMFRRIVPLNIEGFDLSELEDDDIIEAEQYTCMILNMDLDHIVLQCNKFKDKNGPFCNYDFS